MSRYDTALLAYVQGGGPAVYQFTPVQFDGVTDAVSRSAALLNAPDSYSGTISLWIYVDTTIASGPTDGIFGTAGRDVFLGLTTNAGPAFIWLQLTDGLGNSIVANSLPGSLPSLQWTHILISWDLRYPAGQKQVAIHINGVSQIGTVTDASRAFLVPYTSGALFLNNWSFGKPGGGKFLNAYVGDFIMWTTFDIVQPGNVINAPDLANFWPGPQNTTVAISAYGRAAVRFAGDVNSFAVNQGTGGPFVQQGTLTTFSTLLGATIDWNFATGTYTPALALTTTRASVAYVDDLSGNWTQVAANTARISNKGLLVEEQRINSIRNNSMQGAVAGTPGTMPTNWTFNPVSTGLVSAVVGTGTENGIDYMDLNISGTVVANGTVGIYTDAPNITAASQGQTWTNSLFVKLISGSFPVPANCMIRSYAAGPVFLSAYGGVAIPIGAFSGQALGLQRYSSGGVTITDATVAFVRASLEFTAGAGQVWNVTIRIGWPQLEQGSFVTSPIRTTAAAVTRAQDTVIVTSPPALGPASTIFGVMTYLGSTSTFPRVFGLSDGTLTNRQELFINKTGGTAAYTVVSGNVTQWSIQAPVPYVIGTSFKSAGSFAPAGIPNNQAYSYNGNPAPSVSTGTAPVGLNKINIGTAGDNSGPACGYITRVASGRPSTCPTACCSR